MLLLVVEGCGQTERESRPAAHGERPAGCGGEPAKRWRAARQGAGYLRSDQKPPGATTAKFMQQLQRNSAAAQMRPFFACPFAHLVLNFINFNRKKRQPRSVFLVMLSTCRA